MSDDWAAGGQTSNTVSGGNFYGPVLQGQVFHLAVPSAAPVALAQLPPLVTGFTGRGAELAVMAGLLAPGGAAGAVVVSAVAGLAGVGKTALAVQAGYAARERGWFAGGVLFVDLHGYDEAPVEPAQALDALLRALGVAAEHIPPSGEERAGLYRSALAGIGEPVLVIADNASSEAQVRLLLPGPGPHRVVVTSRHTLAGLGARLLDVTVLDEAAGVALLEAVLRSARPEDGRVSGDREAAGRLAGICGELPLALQIAAALLKADPERSVSGLADELAAEQGRLAALRYDDGSGAAVPSVAAAFELSCRRLDETSARVFRLLPASPGPDVSTTAAAVLADLPESQVRGVLGGLARAHLVDGAAGRWQMHDLLRLYARQLSDAHADADRREQARNRLLGYYLDTATVANQHLQALPGTAMPAGFTGQDSALAWLDAERPSLVAAVTMAADTGSDHVAVELPLVLTAYFASRRRFDDWLITIAVSLTTARRLRDRDREGYALTSLGLALREVRRFEEAITACQDAAAIFRKAASRRSAIFRKTANRRSEGMAVNNLGMALREAGRVEEAITAHQDAAAIFRETGDRHSEGDALGNLGLALREAGRLEEAITACQDAAAIFRETGDRQSEGIALGNLGVALREAGRLEEAITAHQDAAAIFWVTADRHREGDALGNLGVAQLEAGRVEEAITTCQDAVAVYRETGDRHREGDALGNLGVALREAGRVEEAITAHQDAAAIYRETGDQDGEGMALGNLETARAAQQA